MAAIYYISACSIKLFILIKYVAIVIGKMQRPNLGISITLGSAILTGLALELVVG